MRAANTRNRLTMLFGFVLSFRVWFVLVHVKEKVKEVKGCSTGQDDKDVFSEH